MIVTVHFIGIILFQILRNRKRLKSAPVDPQVRERTLENQLKFDPPLARQRYGTVSQILVREQWRTQLKKLTDFGCGEFGLFMYLKRLHLEEVLFVDIDEYVLAENLFRIEPIAIDCIRRRRTPLNVSVYRGSIAEPDYRLRKTDVVTAIELIEHLYPDTLDAFPYNVFSFIKPKLVIITTPNADFNIAFGRVEGFRHPDHKFEWTSQQFRDWGTNLTERFPEYSVQFEGIGEGPERFAHLGCCTQAALFIRKDSYTSSDYAKSCQCDLLSPCKGQTVECKLECNCLCPLCLPDISVGVCTYLSRNISSQAYRPMKTRPKSSDSNHRLDYWNPRLSGDIVNKSFNIFYKEIGSVQYLHEADSSLDKERLVDTLKYRVRTFSQVTSRFYVEERQRCEIPLSDLIYGDVELSVEEVGRVLSETGYQVEQCLIPENGQFERCVITMAQEMEEITSSSEVTDGYSSRSSECNENIHNDWDSCPPLGNIQLEQGETSSGPVETKKPPADPLVDSGYLKSPSPLEIASSLPQEPSDLDLFEDVAPTPSVRRDDNKLHLKRAQPSESASNRPKVLDLNRVNELDRFRNVNVTKTFVKPLNELRRSPPRDFPIAGTSTAWKKHHKKGRRSPDKEPTPLDDVKSLTNCIVQNSLNRVEADSPELIDFVEDVVDAPLRGPPPPPPQAVENGDLANNNRDNEGNNLPENEAVEQEDVDEGIDLLNDNLEDLLPLLDDNVAVVENNNEVEEEELPDAVADVVEEQKDDELEQQEDDSSSIAKASREVLYDVDSVPDLLDDVDIPPQVDVNPHALCDAAGSTGTNVVLVGIQPIASGTQVAATASIQTNRNSFPDWLLQILGTQVGTEPSSRSPSSGHDEPHFYCQGDGLGVHPSVMAVEGDDAEEADTSSDETSSNNTVDYADADAGPSDLADMSSLPEESLQIDDADGSVASSGAILVDDIIRAAQDQISNTDNAEAECPNCDSQTSSKSTDSESEAVESCNDSQSFNEEQFHPQ